MPLTLTTHGDVPYWGHTYIYSKDDLEDASVGQKKFYEEYKNAFNKGIYYDLCGNSNYCFVLLFDLHDEYEQYHNDLSRLKTELQILSEAYPEVAPYATDLLIKAFVSKNKHSEAWDIKKQSGAYCIEDIVQFERVIKKSLIDEEVVKSIAGVSCLTSYGKDHVDEIFALTGAIVRRIEKDKRCRFSSIFIRRIKWEKYNLLEYESYYSNKKEYKNYFHIDQRQTDFRWGTNAIPHTVQHGMQAHLQTIVRQAENECRESHGLPRIGEGWIGETELYYFIKGLLPKCTVVHHARPEWLIPQHLDILIQEHDIAIEYQGEQHFRPIEYFGGDAAFQNNVKRDAIKREKCEANGCRLIYIDKTHNQEYVKDIIQKLINRK